MSSYGISKVIAVFTGIIVIVAVTAFFGGMYVGGLGSLQMPSVQTLTMQRMVTITQTFIQMVTPIQTTSPTAITPSVVLPSKIVIGVSISLSGGLADAGKPALQGILTAIKWVNEVYGGVHLYGRAIPLEVRYYDDESNKDLVAAYTERLITVDKVHFILSSDSSILVAPQAPITEKYKMLLVNWGGASDEIFEQGYRYMVAVQTLASRYLWTALDALKATDPNAKNVAIMYADDEFNRAAGKGASARAKELGFNVIYEKSYPMDIKDFGPYIADLARVNADALIVSARFADGQLLTRQLADAGVNFKLIAINVAPCAQSYYDTFKTLAEGILCPSQWEPGVRYSPELAKRLGIEWFGPTVEEFMSIYKSLTNLPPIYHTGIAGAAVLLLVKAIETAQSLDPSAVREAFNKLHLMTFFGEFKIDPTTGKQVAHEMVLTQWQKGNRVVVWPPTAAEKRLYYPIPTWDEKRAGKVASY